MYTKILDYINKNRDRALSFIIFRTDRIGDVVLSIQVAELIKRKFKDSRITFVVRKYTEPLLDNNPYIDDVLCVDDKKTGDLVREISERNYDISISLFSSRLAALASALARIPIRIGPTSKIWGILFYNIKIKQRRSQSVKNEALYNIDLLKPLGIEEIRYPKIYLDEKEKEEAKSYCKDRGLERFVLIHPGSGNSAKNWPIDNFFRLAKGLKVNGVKILITGNSDELREYKEIVRSYGLDISDIMEESLPMREFLGLISRSELFITNSTGPLHCAVALGILTISFYCPIKTCRSVRWGPFSGEADKHYVYMPKVDICLRCCFTSCKYFNCMEQIRVETVLEKIIDMKEELRKKK